MIQRDCKSRLRWANLILLRLPSSRPVQSLQDASALGLLDKLFLLTHSVRFNSLAIAAIVVFSFSTPTMADAETKSKNLSTSPQTIDKSAKKSAQESEPSSQKKTILILGDSLTEGYGVDRIQAYPALLESNLISMGYQNLRVINGGVSGATTASGAGRLDWYLKADVNILILALGANDGLRGIKISETKTNLTKIIKRAQKKKIQVILAGMKVPPNYGKKRGQQFEKVFTDLAKAFALPLIPFLLEGVAGKNKLNLQDRIHPNPRGHQIISNTVSQSLIPWL